MPQARGRVVETRGTSYDSLNLLESILNRSVSRPAAPSNAAERRVPAAQARPPTHRVFVAITVVAALLAVGTAGYMLIERMSFIDALYMTVITITTVGYEEVKRLDSAGRIFTMGLIFTGVGTAFYLLGSITEAVVGGQLRERFERSAMNRKIHHLENHVVLCGY